MASPATFTPPGVRTELPLLIAFADLSRFATSCERHGDREAAEVMHAFYTLVCEKVVGAGGAVVKFLGDAALIVFPEERADAGVVALLELRHEVDAWLAARGWDSRLIVKGHVGTVVAGPFGPPEYGRVDVLGAAVNQAATLPSRGFALSTAAFRKLAPETRRRFRKHTPPVTYITPDSPRP